MGGETTTFDAPTLVPILSDLRALYNILDRMKRFEAYVDLLSGKTRGEPLPIGNFSPMGQRQSEYLDKLLGMPAENEAEVAIQSAMRRLPDVEIRARVMLVVVDEPRNGWTQRSLTDASWRFDPDTDATPKRATAKNNEKWISVQLWTDIDPTPDYVHRETLSAIYRFAHRQKFGLPNSLFEMMLQEGRALCFAGFRPSLSPADIDRVATIVRPNLQCSDYPTCFASLYGDDAARSVGYSAVGIPTNGGFDLAVSMALLAGPTEQVLAGIT